jgi:hypothetical protein
MHVFHLCRNPMAIRCLCAWLLVAGSVCVGQSGCVQRRMTIRSNPPGALVYVDDYEIGTTPISTDFLYYGTRKIRLVKPGYETLTVMQPVPAPWYEVPPLDFFSENLTPREIRDRRTFSYTLRPQRLVPSDVLLGRAESLRQSMRPARAAPPVLGPAMGAPVQPAPTGPALTPVPRGPEPIPIPSIGGQPVYPLPPSGPVGQ